MLGLSKCIKCGVRDKMKIVFEVLDKHGNGSSGISDLLDVVKSGSAVRFIGYTPFSLRHATANSPILWTTFYRIY